MPFRRAKERVGARDFKETVTAAAISDILQQIARSGRQI